MAKLKSLLISGNGQVGSALHKVFSEKKYPLHGTWFDLQDDSLIFADLRDENNLRRVFGTVRPQAVILNAGLTHVDYCEQHPDEAAAVNVRGVLKIARMCDEYMAKIVFFSSEYIFDGASGPYSESDKTNPLNVYGKQKLEAEEIVANAGLDWLIVRTTVVYGQDPQGKNFVARLVRSLRQGETVKVANDQISTPTYSADLAGAVETLVRQDRRGLYNVAGADRLSRYDFAILVCEEFGLDKNLVRSVTTEELGQAATRPLSAGLKIDKLKQDTGLSMLGAREGLRRMRKECDALT